MSEKINNTGRIIDGEFWSEKSLEKRPITEQYPKTDGESAEEYEARIADIQTATEIAQENLTEQDKKDIENGAYTEKSGKAPTVDFQKFGMTALRTFDMKEKNPGLMKLDEGKYGLARQQAQELKAGSYIDIYEKKQPSLSEFKGKVPDRKLQRDEQRLSDKAYEISDRQSRLSPNERDNEEQMQTWDHIAEAVMYPLVLNYGLFDLVVKTEQPQEPQMQPRAQSVKNQPNTQPSTRAKALYPSVFDDQFHGVDAAFEIPTGVTKKGEIRYVPVSFDCTTATSERTVAKKFDNTAENGLTKIEYAKTEDGDLRTDLRPINFTLGFDHRQLINNDNGLMRGDNIEHMPREMRHNLYVQIYHQARLRTNTYLKPLYERATSPDQKPRDVFTPEELAAASDAAALRDYFAGKCAETARSQDKPYDLEGQYDTHAPSYLVLKKTNELLAKNAQEVKAIRREKWGK